MKTYPCFSRLRARALALSSLLAALTVCGRAANPAIVDPLTADPAALVHNGTVYLYTGHDEAGEKHQGYVMKKWLVFSSTDMVTWKAHPSPMSLADFPWAKENAWAGHVVEKGGEFYWYAPVSRGGKAGFAIGVAVADNPLGPFKDARGSAMITNEMTTDVPIEWDDIDPAAFIDDDGQAYLFWGNQRCRYVKLKANMTEFEGEIVKVDVPHFTEAPWVHKRGEIYYLTYATGFPEKIAYATSKSITGPWEYRGLLAELAGNSNTIHQSIITYKGRDYFIYHNGGTPLGGSFRRSVCIDYLYYNPDGTMKRVVQTSEGVEPAK
ncbi:glycoside hydrolase [Nibricoccus aquaticus]|uniref:Glycoside hydrolase n=1 Tax=Nibricoccus aquaticus TaxID=2576891 RepID=A0A290QMT1_9BACT|nr:glycoside hydrolase family 43 protein [Nibricoccus aquaticus]ATC65971.1 glycoside hydrolase [Nibricoccus aquaticus]